MGDVVILAGVRRPQRFLRPCRPDRSAEIAFFTGVRIERWVEPEPVDPRDPPRRPPRRRRGR